MLERDIVLEVAGSPVPMTGRAVANVEPGVHLGVAYPRRREESTRTQSGQEVTTA
jgi:hypothetical protein